MKTTIELPDALVRQVKLRAVHEGRKLKDVITELLRRGLAAPIAVPSTDAPQHTDYSERSGLPIVRCKHPASDKKKLSESFFTNLAPGTNFGFKMASAAIVACP